MRARSDACYGHTPSIGRGASPLHTKMVDGDIRRVASHHVEIRVHTATNRTQDQRDGIECPVGEPEIAERAKKIALPANLRERIEAVFEEEPAMPWDVAVARIVTKLPRASLQCEDGVTTTMETDTADLVCLDQGSSQTLTSRQKRCLPAARARADNS